MRTEEEMFHLILKTAEEDDRIRAVFMNGSRTNPNADKDIFQDYDIVYVVTETRSFEVDKNWIDCFGQCLYMQYPEDSCTESEKASNYGWLIQLSDGNRLDLHVQTVAYACAHIKEDRLCIILLDKDKILPDMPASTDRDYWVRKPDEREFRVCCNEFWWCLNNVAKGLWREEVPYVQDILNLILRPQLLLLLSFKAGIKTGFTASVGKSAKYLSRYLKPEEWAAYLATYPSGSIQELWNSITQMCVFFDATAMDVAAALGYSYNSQDAAASLSHFLHVKALPQNAEYIYERN